MPANNLKTGDKEFILRKGNGTSSDVPTSVRDRDLHGRNRVLRTSLLPMDAA